MSILLTIVSFAVLAGLLSGQVQMRGVTGKNGVQTHAINHNGRLTP